MAIILSQSMQQQGGVVESPGVVLSPFENEIFHSCMLKEISSWNFPPSLIRKYVVHTFKFDKKK